MKAIKHIHSIYKRRDLNITTINLDGEFTSLRDDLLSLNINLNAAVNDEHVPVAERYI